MAEASSPTLAPKRVTNKNTAAPRTTQPKASVSPQAKVMDVAGKGVSAGMTAAKTVTSATATSASRAAGWGVGAVRGSARAVGGALTGGSANGARDPVAGFTLKVPFASASLKLPGPGAVATVGPVTVKLPTGALYYGGLAALVATGALEFPVAAGAAVAGAVLARRWLRAPMPEVSVFDTKPGSAAPSNSDAPAPSG